MPDNNKQGRTSNKAMTFFVCFLAATQDSLWLDIGVIAGALPFIADEFQINAHTGMGGQLHDVWRGRWCLVGSSWLSFKLGRKRA